MNSDSRIEEHCGEFLRHPMQRTRHGWKFALPHGKTGGVVAMGEVHQWRDGWQPIEYTPESDHAGGFGYPHRPDFRILPGGFIKQGELITGVRSMGVLRHQEYVPIWKAGRFGVTDLALKQALGPYEVRTELLEGGKQDIILPQMPAIDGDELVLDYYGKGLQPPETCDCKPVVIDSAGREVPMRKWRTPWGKQESISLDVLAGLAFPVILDPELVEGGWWTACSNANYALANSTGCSWGTTLCRRQAQYFYNPPFTANYSRNRSAPHWNLNAYTSDPLSAAWLKTSCCDPREPPVDKTDIICLSQCDWEVWDPPDLFTIANVRACIKAGPLGTELYSIQDLYDAGCLTTPNCGYVDYHPLDAADVSWINTTCMWRVPPDRYVRFGMISKRDFNNSAPTDYEGCWVGHRGSVCGQYFKFEQGAGGGWSWLVS